MPDQKQLLILSDLHIGWEQSCVESMFDELTQLAEGADLIISNGDLIHGRSPEKGVETFAAVLQYAKQYPQKDFIFLSGNHEGFSTELYQRIREQVEMAALPNVRFMDEGLLLGGDHLITHGDMILRQHQQVHGEARRANPHNPEDALRVSRAENGLKMLHDLFEARANNPELPYPLQDLEGNRLLLTPEIFSQLKGVVYGHTHRGHEGEEYGGKIYYNTGSFEYKWMAEAPKPIHVLKGTLVDGKVETLGLAIDAEQSPGWQKIVQAQQQAPVLSAG
jgi:UDP-2,3-diacylglucosamine pyrophosphatase LpxH